MRVLITGAGGMVGRALTREMGIRHELLALPKSRLDVTDAQAVRKAVADFRPHAIAHLAAWTDVDGCELESAKARRINVEGTQNVVSAALECGAKLLYMSTDYVFDGTATGPIEEDATPNPINEYGRTKLAGEQAVLAQMTEYFIVRTSWVFGEGGRNFVDTVSRLARERDHLDMVDDQVGCPTYAADLAEALARILESRKFGIYHVTNDTECSWYMLAQEILKGLGLEIPLIPVSSEAYPRPARRPRYSVLANFRLHHLHSMRLRTWRAAVREYLEEQVPA